MKPFTAEQIAERQGSMTNPSVGGAEPSSNFRKFRPPHFDISGSPANWQVYGDQIHR